MMTFLKYIFIFLIPSLGFGQTEDCYKVKNPELIFDKISKRSDKLTSLKCAFKQTKYINSYSVRFESTGNLYIKKENKLKWEYLEPYSYSIVIKNSEVLVKNNGGKTDFDSNKSEIFSRVNTVIGNINTGKFKSEDKSFFFSVLENKQDYLIVLKPKDNQTSEVVSEIKIHFDKSSYAVKSIRVNEITGDYTMIDFYDFSVNHKISDSIFEI